MDFTSICRTCLRNDSLNPIFITNNDSETYSNAIYIATGVKVQYNDKLPQNMCTDCINKLTDILKFRIQCKEVETKLLNIINETSSPDNQADENNYIQDIRLADITITDINEDSIIDTTIKSETNEPKIKNETDLEDNKPLKLFVMSPTLNRKSIDTEVSYETVLETNILRNNNKEFTQTKIYIKDDDRKREITEQRKPFKKSKSHKKVDEICTNVTELPYQLLTDNESQKNKRVRCKLCNKELSIRSINSHMMRTHPGADERKVKCDLCDSYIMKDKMNRHRVLMHGNENYKCGYCKKEYYNKEELVEHVSSCTAKKKARKVNEAGRELRECDICHKVMQKASIRMHKAVKHAGLKPVCEHCGKSFGNKFRLHEHYRAKHGYEKFQCSYCDFKSAGAMAMRNHERRHRGEKPYVCETCGAKFHAAYLLAQHRHSHKTEKSVKCDQCPATFKANNSLHMHRLTCHSTNMFRCIVCSKSYKCRHYAVKHMRHVHRYNGPTPPLAVLSNEDDKTGT